MLVSLPLSVHGPTAALASGGPGENGCVGLFGEQMPSPSKPNTPAGPVSGTLVIVVPVVLLRTPISVSSTPSYGPCAASGSICTPPSPSTIRIAQPVSSPIGGHS